MFPKKQQTRSTNLENFCKSDYLFIPFSVQSIAKPYLNSSRGETMLREFEMTRVTITRFKHSTKLSNIFLILLCKRFKICFQNLQHPVSTLAKWVKYVILYSYFLFTNGTHFTPPCRVCQEENVTNLFKYIIMTKMLYFMTK